MHTLIVFNPGHFHAALALRYRHHMLSDEVFVYAEEGPDLDRFLALVEVFNRREDDPTSWTLHIYRGTDCLERLIAERKGDVVVVAGKNDYKLESIARLQAAGFAVLGDKPWLIDAQQIGLVRQVAQAKPLVMDMMTERQDIGHRLVRALAREPAIFGQFEMGSDPAIAMVSVHHLFKLVNGQPLQRPAWYFDTAIQGEGITDVTTHLMDLALWITDQGPACVAGRDLQLISARQWPTDVPLALFEALTGLERFPESVLSRVNSQTLFYLCNAKIECVLRGINVAIEARWDLRIPPGGGDTHGSVLRGTGAQLILAHDAQTRFETQVSVVPKTSNHDFERNLRRAIDGLQEEFPGLDLEVINPHYRLVIPKPLITTHEQHFSAVLDAFLGYAGLREGPPGLSADVLAKYTILAQAKTLSHSLKCS